MTMTVDWFNEDRTICILERHAGWTWADFNEAWKQANRLITQVQHPVHLLFIGPDQLPPGSPLGHFRQAQKSSPPNLKLMVIVISNPFGRAIFNVMKKLDEDEFYPVLAANSDEEAFEMVKFSESVR